MTDGPNGPTLFIGTTDGNLIQIPSYQTGDPDQGTQTTNFGQATLWKAPNDSPAGPIGDIEIGQRQLILGIVASNNTSMTPFFFGQPAPDTSYMVTAGATFQLTGNYLTISGVPMALIENGTTISPNSDGSYTVPPDASGMLSLM